MRRLVSLPPPSGSLRIEMRHPALLLLNDVSKDRRYAQWPASVKELLRPNMFGQISFCRKNILTMVFVVDPAVDDDLSVLSYMAQLLQNGAPIRLVVPWKYGFKSIKSIARISLTDKQPPTSWNKANAREYGFYSNVNPNVDHPRWSQASERKIGGGLFSPRIPTLMFNGYEAEVASLYEGMDLAKYY
mgnify:CR=1 FL=1